MAVLPYLVVLFALAWIAVAVCYVVEFVRARRRPVVAPEVARLDAAVMDVSRSFAEVVAAAEAVAIAEIGPVKEPEKPAAPEQPAAAPHCGCVFADVETYWGGPIKHTLITPCGRHLALTAEDVRRWQERRWKDNATRLQNRS